MASTSDKVDLEKWCDPKYAHDEMPALPAIRWNSKKTTLPAMYLLDEYAQCVGFSDDSSTWKRGEFTFEPNESTLTVETKPCYFSSEPILAIIKTHSYRTIFRRDFGEHKKGSAVPHGMPYDNNIHSIRPTYVVAVLDRQIQAASPQSSYRLLHRDPLFWSPQSSAGAIFKKRIYDPYCRLVKEQRQDMPTYIFAIHLSSTLEKVGTPSVVVNVPKGIVPTTKEELYSFFVGDEVATVLKMWYDKFSIGKDGNVKEPEIQDKPF